MALGAGSVTRGWLLGILAAVVVTAGCNGGQPLTPSGTGGSGGATGGAGGAGGTGERQSPDHSGTTSTSYDD